MGIGDSTSVNTTKASTIKAEAKENLKNVKRYDKNGKTRVAVESLNVFENCPRGTRIDKETGLFSINPETDCDECQKAKERYNYYVDFYSDSDSLLNVAKEKYKEARNMQK
ncbi:MAG: hypothetical protein GX568_02105 [Candidatus Gastranaerophilales bacterium]|nr:hypothetical protein [Candidatus Gastranaerophilales bacterium]